MVGCAYCSERFDTYESLREHEVVNHPGQTPVFSSPPPVAMDPMKDYMDVMNRFVGATRFQSAASIAASLTHTYLSSNQSLTPTEDGILEIFDGMYRGVLRRFFGEPDTPGQSNP